MSKLDWKHISLYFPEWGLDLETDKKSLIGEGFPEIAKFSDGGIAFSFGEYGVEVRFDSSFPDWIPRTRKIVGIYENMRQNVYEEVISQLTISSEIFESLREHVKRCIKTSGAVGLQDHIEFFKRGERVSLGDYYFLGKNNLDSPTYKLLKIGKLPKELLNEKGLRFLELSCYAESSGRRNTSNSIVGSSIFECAKRAQEIYSFAEELKDLKVDF